MTNDEVITILKMLRVKKMRAGRDGFLHTQCFFAPYADEHGDHYDSKPSMWISIDNGVSYCECWTCGSNPRVGHKQRFVDAVEAINRLSDGLYNDAVEKAHEFEKFAGRRRYRPVYIPSDNTDDYEQYLNIDDLPRTWLAEKGVQKTTTLEKFRIGVSEDKDIVLFPIINRINAVVGAQARSVEHQENKGKYFSVYEDTQKSHHVFGEHLLDLTYENGKWVFHGKAILVFEGPLDVLHAYDVGLRNVVGIMGAKISPVQAQMLAKLARGKLIALIMDPDKAGRQGAFHSLHQVFLEHAPSALVQAFVPQVDPKEMTLSDFSTLINGDPTWLKQPTESLLQKLEKSGRRRKRS